MSKRVARQRKRKEQKSRQRRSRRPLAIFCLLLILTLAIGVMAQWKILPGTSKPLALAANPTGNFNSNSPSKEYIYAGGRLIATEEPTPSSATVPSPTPTPTPAQTFPQGPAPGTYHSLNPSGVWVEVPNSASLNITGPITVEAWIKPTGTSAVRGIVERYGAGEYQGGYALRIAYGKLQFYTLKNGNDHAHVDGATNITTNTWHHVAGVFTGSELRVYLDGVLDGVVTTTRAPETGNTSLIIGNTGYSLNNFDGLIDEARVTAGAIYTSNFTPQSHLLVLPDTKGMWTFDNQSAGDLSGQGNSGTLLSGGQYSTDVPGTGIETVWFDDQLPAGASPAGASESWNWMSSNPSPVSGTNAHQSALAAGFHNHYFTGASTPFPVNAGDKLITYVYLDPANMPSEIMVQWNDGTNWYNAYWGADQINWVARQYAGPLPGTIPGTGGWVRLEVPASLLGLEGKTVNGMAFNLWDGRATWDRAGKLAQGQ